MRTVLRGLCFPESPRWHDGELWFSDIFGHAIMRTTVDGDAAVVAEVLDDVPSGLGWLPDGRLIYVAMTSQKLMRIDSDGIVEHADLTRVARGDINDMIVAADGTAYVGDIGAAASSDGGAPPVGQLIRVTPGGEATCAAEDFHAPNGPILTDDGRTLIVAESRAGRLSMFDVRNDTTIDNRRTFADLTPRENAARVIPDGICLDAEGAVWVADVGGKRLMRVLNGGHVVDEIDLDGAKPLACVLGGVDRRTLLVCIAGSESDVGTRNADGRIDACEVDVPGAGLP